VETIPAAPVTASFTPEDDGQDSAGLACHAIDVVVHPDRQGREVAVQEAQVIVRNGQPAQVSYDTKVGSAARGSSPAP
jgi:hypothetical protein